MEARTTIHNRFHQRHLWPYTICAYYAHQPYCLLNMFYQFLLLFITYSIRQAEVSYVDFRLLNGILLFIKLLVAGQMVQPFQLVGRELEIQDFIVFLLSFSGTR